MKNKASLMLRNKLLVFVSLFLIIFSLSRQASAQKEEVVEVPMEEIKAGKLDPKARILAAYLARFNSPMQYHAQDFIDAANTYNLDWKLLPSIAGVESTFGKQIPGGYNAWGWGVYGDQAIYFNSWRDGMFTIAKGLRENYLNQGLTDPYSINRVYAASPHWGRNVTYFLNDLEKFADQFEAEKEQSASVGSAAQIAAVSGTPRQGI